jgi:hypothetical protein
MTTEAVSQGLSESQIRYYCSLGAQTPVSVRPYCGGGYRGARRYRPEYDDQDDYAQPQRRLSRSEIQYYCSLGSQTPLSVRHLCGRY